MSTIPLLNHMALDDNGDPIPGALLHTYESGTTTELATYSNEALTAANTNPIEADADGRFGPIYLSDDEYTIVFADADDVTIWTRDGVKPVSLAGASIAARQKQIASNPLDYGAVGDGVADESSAVQAAIDAATGVVDLLGKTFRCDSQITLSSGVTLRNGTLDFSNCGDDEYIVVRGTVGSNIEIESGDGAAGSSTVTLGDVSGLVSGDLLYLETDDSISGYEMLGEIVRVDSIAGLVVTLTEPLRYGHDTIVDVFARRLNPAENVTIEGVTVLCDSAASGDGEAIVADVTDRFTIRDVVVKAPKGVGVRISRSVGALVDRCDVIGDSVTGIGFIIGSFSQRTELSRCRAMSLDIGISVGETPPAGYGTVMDTTAYVSCEGCTVGWEILDGADYTTASGPVSVPSGGAISDVEFASNLSMAGVSRVGTLQYKHPSRSSRLVYLLEDELSTVAIPNTGAETSLLASTIELPRELIASPGSVIRLTFDVDRTTTSGDGITVGDLKVFFEAGALVVIPISTSTYLEDLYATITLVVKDDGLLHSLGHGAAIDAGGECTAVACQRLQYTVPSSGESVSLDFKLACDTGSQANYRLASLMIEAF